MGKHYRVSADIGGTFTDIVFQDSVTGECGAVKVLSTPENPALSVLEGIKVAIPSDATIDFFVHGTTVGLNALLTRRGAKAALLTAHNFRDIYTIQGNDRGAIFSIQWDKPKPLTPLKFTYTTHGRIAATGAEVEPLSETDLQAFVDEVKREGFAAIAICFLFSYKNPAHELAAAAYIAERLPDIAVALSHKVSPEWWEFERTSTTVMDSYLAPVVRKYLGTLVSDLKDCLPVGQGLHVMESNGGVMSAATASGPPATRAVAKSSGLAGARTSSERNHKRYSATAIASPHSFGRNLSVGLRFNKRIKIMPGVKLNIGLGGISTTIGPRGASLNVGKKGVYANAGLPGTGISSRTKIAGTTARSGTASVLWMVLAVVLVVSFVIWLL